MSSGSTIGTNPPAGWYPDPQQAGLLRYWDGGTWTEQTHDGTTADPAPGAGWSTSPQQPNAHGYGGYPASPYGTAYGTYGSQFVVAAAAPTLPLGIGKALRILIVIQAVGFALLTMAGFAYYSAGMRFLDNPTFGNYDDVISAEDAYLGGWGLQFLAGIATFVLLIVWSFKVTKWAQAQGAELRHSPGWAIGGWFVPIASLFIPIQVLNDLYRYADPAMPRPIGRHHRGRPGSGYLLGWWLALLGSGALLQFGSTLFDATDTESDFRLGLTLRAIAPIASAFALVMLLLYHLATTARLERHRGHSGY